MHSGDAVKFVQKIWIISHALAPSIFNAILRNALFSILFSGLRWFRVRAY